MRARNVKVGWNRFWTKVLQSDCKLALKMIQWEYKSKWDDFEAIELKKVRLRGKLWTIVLPWLRKSIIRFRERSSISISEVVSSMRSELRDETRNKYMKQKLVKQNLIVIKKDIYVRQNLQKMMRQNYDRTSSLTKGRKQKDTLKIKPFRNFHLLRVKSARRVVQ